MSIERLKSERKAAFDNMKSMLDAAEAVPMTTEQRGKYDELETVYNTLSNDIDRAERFLTMEAKTAAPAVIVDRQKDTESGFSNFGDFICATMNNRSDSRINSRAVTMGDQASIGYIVPPQFSTNIVAVKPQDAIVRPRATILPPSEGAPDAPLSIPSLDQSDGVRGGVQVHWTAETAARQNAGDPVIKQVTLTPNEVSGYVNISNKLINNSDQASAYIENLLRMAIIAEEEKAFISGDGVGKPRGFVGFNNNVTIQRKTAGTITFDDLTEMDAVSLYGAGGDYVFIAARTAKPTLTRLTDGAGQLIWGNAVNGAPPTILGIPVFFSDNLPKLGTSGDIVLVNLSAYAIKDGSPLSLIVDPYTQLVNGQSRIYVFWNVDGQNLLTSPVKGDDDESRSVVVKLS